MSNYLGFKPTTKKGFYFVSYNNDEAIRIGAIAKALYDSGVPLWYDKGLESAEQWETQLAKKIKDSKAVLLFFTKSLLLKEHTYVKREYDIAKTLKKKIFVVVLDSISDIDVPVDKLSWWLDINEMQLINVSNKEKLLVDAIADTIIDELGISKDSEEDNNVATEDKYNDLSNFVLRGQVLIKYKGESDTLYIPKNIVQIGFGAFKDNKHIKTVILPPGLKYIESCAFENCEALENVNFPSSLEKIDFNAFFGCKSLNSADLKEGLKELGTGAFQNCISLHTINIPNSIEKYGIDVFNGCESINNVIIPDNMLHIPSTMFSGCKNLLSVTLHDKLETIGIGSFFECVNLKSIEFPRSLIDIGMSAFKGCTSLIEIDFHDEDISVGSQAFMNCQLLESVKGTMGIKKYDFSVFEGCQNIRYFLSNAERIYGEAFARCTLLHSFIQTNKLNSIDNGVFYRTGFVNFFYEESENYWKQHVVAFFGWKRKSSINLVFDAHINKNMYGHLYSYHYNREKIDRETYINTRLCTPIVLETLNQLLDALYEKFGEETFSYNEEIVHVCFTKEECKNYKPRVYTMEWAIKSTRITIHVGVNALYIETPAGVSLKGYDNEVEEIGKKKDKYFRKKLNHPSDIDDAIDFINSVTDYMWMKYCE